MPCLSLRTAAASALAWSPHCARPAPVESGMDEKVFEGLSRGGEEGQRAIAELLQVKAAELGALGKALLERTSGLVVSKQELRARQKKLDDEHTKVWVRRDAGGSGQQLDVERMSRAASGAVAIALVCY